MERIVTDSMNIPDGEIFTVYKEDDWWAFAIRINKKFSLTRFQSPKVDKGGVMKVAKQIRFCRDYGWSYTGQKTLNTKTDDLEPEFTCLYCKRSTYDISEPCPCRNKTKEDTFVTTPSGIVLPY